MDTVLDRPWTTESFLAWEDRQECKYEFDGQRVIPMTGGTLAHQRIVFNLCLTLMGLLREKPLLVVQTGRAVSCPRPIPPQLAGVWATGSE